ncbi:MAG: hypothetical protein LBU73_00550 [Helicobacteraceae bacterium]|nr:hypothetical protein [Helicobacteraceae bacterium]
MSPPLLESLDPPEELREIKDNESANANAGKKAGAKVRATEIAAKENIFTADKTGIDRLYKKLRLLCAYCIKTELKTSGGKSRKQNRAS